MLYQSQEENRFEIEQTRMSLIQGDSVVLYVEPYDGEEAIPLDKIESCKFKLSDYDFKEEFVKELVKEDGVLVLRLTSEETKDFKVDIHHYELEYTLIGGFVTTPNQWIFEVLDQINK